MQAQRKEIVTPTMIDVLEDQNLLGAFIENQDTFRRWKTFHRAVDALPPEPGDMDILKHHAGLSKWPSKPFKRITALIGVRGGKSITAGHRQTYEPVFRMPSRAVGEKIYYITISPTKKQSSIIKSYVSANFHQNDLFRPYLLREVAEEIELTNGAVIAILSSDYKTLRGYTAAWIILDEASFLDVEGSRPAIEVERAALSRLVSTDGVYMKIGTPFAKSGPAFEDFRRYWGVDGAPCLVWRGTSLEMNPSLDARLVEQAISEDPEGGKSDYLAEFRSDRATYTNLEIVENCITPNVYERGRTDGVWYSAFCDPAGGSGRDSMTLAIGHVEPDGRQVLDCLREVPPPFSPVEACKDFAATIKSYDLPPINVPPLELECDSY